MSSSSASAIPAPICVAMDAGQLVDEADVIGSVDLEVDAVAALAGELELITALERIIRRAQAEQYRCIEQARRLAAAADERDHPEPPWRHARGTAAA